MDNAIWKQKRLLLAIVFLFAVVAHLPTIANPGFYNHDEWQKFDHVQEIGFKKFVRDFIHVSPGADFGFPVRPVSFIEQGFASIFMKDAPWLSHGIDVLVHLLCGLMFYRLMLKVSRNDQFSILSLVVYLVSPLSIFSTSWLGASVDRMYVLMGLGAAHSVFDFCTTNKKLLSGVIAVLFLVAAIFSKETALALIPVLLCFAAYLLFRDDGKFYRHPSIYVLTFAFGCVAVGYLAFRLPAIMGTIHGAGVSTYTPSTLSIPRNLFAYFCYPFALRATDMTSLGDLSDARFIFAFLLHGLFVAVFGYVYGARRALVYLAGYFVFLLPVISLPTPGAHYLYGSNVLFATMVGAVWLHILQLQGGYAPLARASLVVSLFIAFVHFFQIQRFFYKEGMCQAEVTTSLNARLLTERLTHAIKQILIEGDQGARTYVPRKILFSRQMGEYKGISIIFSPDEIEVEQGELLRVRMSESCLIY